ncbi:MAG: DUF432 domain-containing protein [Deltaproteobacteria bacterium]|nr:DUF432 domain-containing protein [Deltaproteobacteria bacterium]
MFGTYEIPVEIREGEISVSLRRDQDLLIYHRECLGDACDKHLVSKAKKILIVPTEPVTQPKAITPYLFIKFAKPLLLEPQSTARIYVTFPVEIGVFAPGGGNPQFIDAFTLAEKKFTLYGDPSMGRICRYWNSAVHSAIPDVDELREGIMELTIQNTDADWVEVKKAVFNAYGMKIFYDQGMISMRSTMKLRPGDTAETSFGTHPIKKGSTQSVERYALRKISVATGKFVMEYGL